MGAVIDYNRPLACVQEKPAPPPAPPIPAGLFAVGELSKHQKRELTAVLMSFYAIRDRPPGEPFSAHPLAIQVARELGIPIADSAKAIT